jgi:hypothetical protein
MNGAIEIIHEANIRCRLVKFSSNVPNVKNLFEYAWCKPKEIGNIQRLVISMYELPDWSLGNISQMLA